MKSRFGFPQRETQEINLGGKESRLDGGLNTADLPYTLDSTQSPRMCNLWFQDGSLAKRWGQEILSGFPVVTQIDTAFADGDEWAYVQADSAIYKTAFTGTGAVFLGALRIPDGAERAPAGKFLRSGTDLIFFNGVDYKILSADSNTFSDIPVYIPTLFGHCTPATGIGEEREEYNLLSDSYIISYDAASTSEFQLPPGIPLGEGTVSALVNGTEMAQGDGFTVNRTLRRIIFSATPSAGFDNVILKIQLPEISRAADILSCTCGVLYGGDSRMILGGNGTNELFCSAAYNPGYFPPSCALRVGNGEAITGFGLQYDFLAVFKAHEIAYVRYAYSSEKTVLSANILNPFTGCDMPGSICNIGNRIVFANTEDGVCLITSTSRENERNILFISRNIDSLLFAESTDALRQAQGFVFDGRYWLSAGSHVYLWDHSARPLNAIGGEDNMRRLAWYYFDNIPSAAFFSSGRQLYYCRRTGYANGAKLVRFTRSCSDFGEAIPALWQSAQLDFGHPNRYKRIEHCWIIFHGRSDSAADIRYLYSDRDYHTAAAELSPISYGHFSWSNFSWKRFSWGIPGILKAFVRPIRRRHTVFFSIELSNTQPGRDLALSDITIQYRDEYTIR